MIRMKLFLHALNSWFLSIFSLATVLFIAEMLQGNPGNLFYIGLSEYLLLLLFGLLLGLPSFLIAWGLLSFVIYSYHTPNEKFFLWYVALILSVVINTFLIMGFWFSDDFTFQGLLFFWPVYLAGIVVVSFRYKQFFNLIYKKQDDGNF